MATFRVMNEREKYHDDRALHDVISYCAQADKTEGLVGAMGVSPNPDWAIMQMQIVQSCFGKRDGVPLRHFVISFGEWDQIQPLSAFALGQKIAEYYGWQYQIIFGVHTDTENLHIHFVMNTVSYIDGKKYPGDKRDYYEFLQYANETVKPYHTYVRAASSEVFQKDG